MIKYFLNLLNFCLRISHCVSFARQCKLMYRKNSHKTSSRFFFFFFFFIVRLPHWVLDMSLNAQPGVNKFYLLFIYIPHFMMKLCRMCSKYLLSVLFFICFCDIYNFGFNLIDNFVTLIEVGDVVDEIPS